MENSMRFILNRAASLLGVAVLAMYGGSVLASNGDNISTLIADRTGTACASANEAGGHNDTGVGIAFDGDNLLISCAGDNTVTKINPTNGSQVAIHTITGASILGALAWDANNNQLWGCSNFTEVGIIDLSANSFAKVFDSLGCFDGLAYDGTDDTIWSSHDVSLNTQHYSVDGTSLASFSNIGKIGACGNSGIAVGGSSALYLANNGCSEIYRLEKDFSASVLFSSFPARLEDLECDPITFSSLGLGAIWSIDAYDNILNAWEIPADQCLFGGGGEEILGRMTGGGNSFTVEGGRVTHSFELHCDSSDYPNNLQVNMGYGKSAVNFHMTSLDSATCSNDPSYDPGQPVALFDKIAGTGTGRCNGVDGATIVFTFVDAGEPGYADYALINVSGCGSGDFMVDGPIANGNFQAHGD